jgi:hypothetical protein
VHFDLCFVYTLLQYKFLFKSCFIQILINDSVKCIYSRVSALLNIFFFLFFTTNQIKSKVKMSLINSKYWDPSKFSLIKPPMHQPYIFKKKKKRTTTTKTTLQNSLWIFTCFEIIPQSSKNSQFRIPNFLFFAMFPFTEIQVFFSNLI